EGAADGDPVRTRGEGLLGAVVVDPRAELLLHPHPRPTGAAAEGLLAAALHLGVLDTGQDLQQFARRCVDLVVPAQVAGVVVGDLGAGRARARDAETVALTGSRHGGEALLPDEAVEQLGV